MRIILLEDVKKLGQKGDVVNVAEGHARNFLIPRGLAAEATQGKINELDRQKQIKANKHKKAEDDARLLGQRMEGLKVTMTAKVGDAGKLFGAISSKDIVDAIKKQHGLNVDKKKVLLESPIKTLGVHDVAVKLHPLVHVNIMVEVVAK
ncbi:MAG: 50S ribosomal protein L9 [Desulfotomaculaceae bacterium]